MGKKPAWALFEGKLRRERKATLVDLLHELYQISPDAQRFLLTRYGGKQSLAERIKPYRQLIKSQFVLSEWSNTVSWDFAGVHKSIDDYTAGSQGDAAGICELLVIALETAVSFADSINMQDEDFDNELTDIADKCIQQIEDHAQFIKTYNRRLKKVNRIGCNLGYYAMSESLDRLVPLQQ